MALRSHVLFALVLASSTTGALALGFLGDADWGGDVIIVDGAPVLPLIVRVEDCSAGPIETIAGIRRLIHVAVVDTLGMESSISRSRGLTRVKNTSPGLIATWSIER